MRALSQKKFGTPSLKEKKARRATTEGVRSGKKGSETKATETTSGDIYEFRGSSDGELDIGPRKRRKFEEMSAVEATFAHGIAAKRSHDPIVKDLDANREDDITNVTASESSNVLSSREDVRSGILEQHRPPTANFHQDKSQMLTGLQELISPSPTQRLGTFHSQISTTSTIPFATPRDSPRSACGRQAERLISLQSSARGKPPTTSAESADKSIGTYNREVQAARKDHSAVQYTANAPRPGTLDDLDQHAKAEIEEGAVIDAETLNHDELSVSHQTGVQDGMIRPLAENKHHHQPDEFRSDDMGIGLPKEQYQPRPSQSRSSRANDNVIVPENFSKRPETLIKAKAKAKNKRRKTTGGEKYLHEDVEINEMYSEKREWDTDELPKKGSSPVKMPAKGSKEGPDEEEVEVHDGVEVSAKPSEGKKKRGRPRKSIEIVEDGAMVDIPEKPENISSVKPNPTKSTASHKSRKRKKPDAPPHLIDDHSDSEDTGDLATHKDHPTDRSTIHALSETAPNSLPPKTPTLPPPTTPSVPKEKTPSPTKPQAPAQTPQKPTEKGPDKHSPLNRGKISYRVGLSKRARIAPLLRIVGK